MATQTTNPRGALLVLSYFYEPEPNFITADVAAAAAAERPVTVIAPHPNYPYGRFYPGARWWRPVRSVERGVTVWRVPIYPDHSRSKLRRFVSYLSFALAALVLAPLVAGRPQVVWVYQTPFTTAIAALWFRLLHGSRLVYTCADLWPESFTASGVAREGVLMRLLLAYRRWINRRADLIVCSTRGIHECFAGEGVPRERLACIPVWVDGVDGAVPAEIEDGRRIVYAGNLGPAQGLETVIEAAAALRRDGVDVTVELYGTGSSEPALRALAASLRADNVRFHGRVTPEQAFEVSTRALAQIVSLRPTPLFRMTIPSKLFFCFAAAAPVLYGLEGEGAALAEKSGGGLPFTPGDPHSFARAVRELLALPAARRRALRRALRAHYEANYARARLLERYGVLLSDVRSVPQPAAADDRAAARRSPLSHTRAAG